MSMAVKCSHCGADNRDTARFCAVCGARLIPPLPVQPQVWTPPPQSPGVPLPISPGHVIPYPPPPQPVAVHGAPVGFPKQWTGAQPLVEGRVAHVDAPVQEKGSVAGKVAAAGCLALIAPVLAFIPFIHGAQVTVRYMRVEDWQTGRQRSVKVRGEPSGIINVGDWLAVWGKEQSGNIIMAAAFNYTTDAEIKVKK